MNSEDDPFPPNMMATDTPDFDALMDAPMPDNETFLGSTFSPDLTDGVFDAELVTNARYDSIEQSQLHSGPSPQADSQSGATSSTSPDSSAGDSSADSSDNQKAQISSQSSNSSSPKNRTSSTEKPVRQEAGSAITKNEHAIEEAQFSSRRMSDIEYSNQAMKDHFDFDSAASSPDQRPDPPLPTNEPSFHEPRHLTIPHGQSSQAFSHRHPHVSQINGGTLESSPFSPMMNSGFNPSMSQRPPLSSMVSHGSHQDLSTLSDIERPAWLFGPSQVANPYLSSMQAVGTMQPPMASQPATCTPNMGIPGNAPIRPLFFAHQAPQKSRVETQIPIKLAIWPLPNGVTKLHIPSYAVSKPKQMAKTPVEKSPDMLELSTMLVCTSAMQDPIKCRRALKRAAEKNSQEVKTDEQKAVADEPKVETNGSRKSSSGDISSNDEEDQPLNGGEVKICNGCRTRERKRAGRKKSKKPEEDQSWQKGEDKRIIVFNDKEVKEWQPLGSPDGLDDQEPKGNRPREAFPYKLPEGTMQINTPMRITCYCRHQHEKIGFQVIFTLKDHQDRLVAQTMTSSIVITDDHKTHTPPVSGPPPGSMFPNHPLTQAGGMFGQESLNNYGTIPPRHSLSTTDLQGLQRNFDPRALPCNMSPVAMPHDMSQATSATMTPYNLSRQASPSAPSNPVCKRRKATGGSIKIPDALTMTTLPNGSGNSMEHQPWTATGATFPPGSGVMDRRFQSYTHRRSSQAYTRPSTPVMGSQGSLPYHNRAQSLENMNSTPQMLATPNSALGSRAPSPAAGNGQSSHNTNPPARTIHAALSTQNSNPQRQPILNKVIPGEGPKAGGVEITCLGSGFVQGLEVMFGDLIATTTTYWGENSLVCLLPPANRAGPVAVTFKHQHPRHQAQPARFPSSPPPNPVIFRYVDDDEQQLHKQALLIVHQRMTGVMEDPGDIARRIINLNGGGQGSGEGNLGFNAQQQREHAVTLGAMLAKNLDSEESALMCIAFIGHYPSEYEVQYDTRSRKNGQTLLHLAAALGYHRLVTALLNRGAHPDIRDRNGMSPMHLAALNNHAHVVSTLRLYGGDPTIRSLRGFFPEDMTTASAVRTALELSPRSRPQSAGASSGTFRSEPCSSTSLASFVARYSTAPLVHYDDSTSESEDDEYPWLSMAGPQKVLTPAQQWTRSRRSSVVCDRHPLPPSRLEDSSGFLSPPASLVAWRDHLATQIHQFQQSVHWTLPNLPALPPMPNLPYYQDYSMVRRFSSLVPQRQSRPSTSSGSSLDAKDSDSRWWEFLTGGSSPPAYDDIYPARVNESLDLKTNSAARAAADATDDAKCAAVFDASNRDDTVPLTMVKIGKGTVTAEEQEQLRRAHARQVKKLKSDRKLFLVWIPLLTFIVLAMSKDRAPQLWYRMRDLFNLVRDGYQERVHAF